MMLRFRSDASSALILARGKARHSSSQGLFAAGPSPASKGLPSTRGEPRPYARRPARPQSHADRQTPPPRGLRYDAHRAPCWRGAEPDSRGGWGARAQASRLRPPNLGGFFQGQRDQGRSSLTRCAPKSRPFQAFPGVSRARMSFGSSFCPTHSRDHVLCESTGFGGSRALVPLLPRPYAHTGPLGEGQALDRGPKASSGPGALQGEWSPPAPTPGPAWSPASEPGLPASRPGTGGDGGARGQLGADAGWDGGPLSGGHGLQLNRKPGAVCPGRRRRRERGIGGSSSTHARRPGPDICLF